jgi:hypothetical protein
MSTTCSRCLRRIPDWHDATGPDDCRGGEDCREREEDRTRLAWRVVEAARRFLRSGGIADGLALRDALRALDGEG